MKSVTQQGKLPAGKWQCLLIRDHPLEKEAQDTVFPVGMQEQLRGTLEPFHE